MFSKSEGGVKKLVTILATSTPVTVAREEVVENGENPRSNFAQIPCIRYPINFRKQSVLALLDLGSKVNTIYPTFVKELGLPIRLIDVGVQKIDSSMLDTFGIIVAAFSLTDKAN